jgi:hypothetical protein
MTGQPSFSHSYLPFLVGFIKGFPHSGHLAISGHYSPSHKSTNLLLVNWKYINKLCARHVINPVELTKKPYGGIPYCLKRMPKTRALIDINSITLSDKLKELEKYGLIQREAFAETPPTFEYSLGARSIQLSIPSLLQCLSLFPL